MSRPLVLDPEDLAPAARTWLAERAEVVSIGVSDPGFAELLVRADGLAIRTYTQVNADLLDRAPRLRVVGRAGVGLDNVDVVACRSRGVEVVHTPEANRTAVCELVFGLLLDVLRPRTPLTGALDPEGWVRQRAKLAGERELRGMVLGVWGLGRVGRTVARVGAAFGMRVVYHDLREIPVEEREGAEPLDRDRLLGESDVISLHVDGRSENRGLVGAEELSLLRPAAILVNASRGFVVQAEALASWLQRNPRSQALLDVHDPEPVPVGHPLLGLPNALLVPHIGSATAPAKERMSRVVKDVWAVLAGETPRFPAP